MRDYLKGNETDDEILEEMEKSTSLPPVSDKEKQIRDDARKRALQTLKKYGQSEPEEYNPSEQVGDIVEIKKKIGELDKKRAADWKKDIKVDKEDNPLLKSLREDTVGMNPEQKDAYKERLKYLRRTGEF